MWMMGDLFALQKHCVGNHLECWSLSAHVWDTRRIKTGSALIASASNMDRNRHQHVGIISWVGISGRMGQTLQDHIGANKYGVGR